METVTEKLVFEIFQRDVNKVSCVNLSAFSTAKMSSRLISFFSEQNGIGCKSVKPGKPYLFLAQPD